ncbi:MAG: hypothetical protein M3R36_00685 [Bacteroidota bacterium]|nr:hypothetical protein [Bacteroidota bacterium]
MKKVSSVRSILLLSILYVALNLFSCSNKNNENINNGESEEKVMSATDDLNESNDDLFNIEYKDIYDKLSTKGEWVEISPDQFGINMTSSLAPEEFEFQKFIAKNISGINYAYADDADLGMIFVWKPSPNLAVSASTDETVLTNYKPYFNGQWINTDKGWYFLAPTPEEEIVHHYGRWVYNPELEWLWVPGRVWAPAWVEWRESPSLIGWAPIPAGVYISNNSLVSPAIEENKYVIVDKEYFIEPAVYKYFYKYKETKNKITIKEMTKVNGIMVVNKTVINKGPDIVSVQGLVEKTIPKVSITFVNDINTVKFTTEEIHTYVPMFKKIKHKTKTIVNKPKNFKRFDELQKIIRTDEQGKEDGDNNIGKSDDEGNNKGDKNNDNSTNDKGGIGKEKKYKQDNEKNENSNDESTNKKTDDKGKSDDKNKDNDINKKHDGDKDKDKNNKSNGKNKSDNKKDKK